jgi:hypothetical protein
LSCKETEALRQETPTHGHTEMDRFSL